MLTVRLLAFAFDMLAVDIALNPGSLTFHDLFLLHDQSMVVVTFHVLLLDGTLSNDICIHDLVPSKLDPAEYRALPHYSTIFRFSLLLLPSWSK